MGEIMQMYSVNSRTAGILISLLLFINGTMMAQPAIEQPGDYLSLLRNRKVGLVVNNSSMINGQRSMDVLLRNGVRIIRAFGPEHGMNGATAAAKEVGHTVDSATGIQVVSLFGKYYKPNKKDLRNIDLMVFDMQDVGVRFYTYISTLHYVMEACAEQAIPLIVMDRPNPNDGYVDGPVLQQGYESFIGMHRIPIVHGMTIGEYARMINGENWLKNGVQCKLTVIPMKRYRHGDAFHYTMPPSPNLNSLQAIKLYPSLCWFGATAISDGRGTIKPFQLIGAPVFKGVFPFRFVPEPIPGMSENPRYKGDTCYGLDLGKYPQQAFGVGGQLELGWLMRMYQAYPDKSRFFNTGTADKRTGILHFDHLAGGTALREQIIAGWSEMEIRNSWQPGLSAFRKTRTKYLLYDDAPQAVKIMSYNIHHGADAAEKNTLDSMGAFISRSGADIVCLQEVDSVCKRSGNIDQTAALAAAARMQGVFACHFPFENGAYGNALISRYPIVSTKVYRLPIDESAHHSSTAMLTADIKVSDSLTICVAVVHLDYRSQHSRVNQAGQILRFLDGVKHPVILAGDMNGTPGSPEIEELTRRFREMAYAPLNTFPVDRPDRKIDYILLDNRFSPVRYETFSVPFSDHLPIMRTVVPLK